MSRVPLWRGIAFNQDEVCLSSLSAQGIQRALQHTSWLDEADHFSQVDSIAEVFLNPLWKHQSKPQNLEKHPCAFSWAEIRLLKSFFFFFYNLNLYWWHIRNQGALSTASDAGVTLGRPRCSSCVTVMGIIMKNGRTYRANTTAVYQWIYAYSCLAGGCCHLYFSFLSFFPPGFFPWDSYQFVLILPHPGVVVWKLRCRQGKKMCVSEREEERERKDWRERKGKENQCRRWQVWGGGAVRVSFRVEGRVSDP